MDALFGFDISKHKAYQGYASDETHHILYTVVHSQGVNGFVHGAEYVNGVANYKYILLGWDILTLGGVIFLGIILVKNIREKESE